MAFRAIDLIWADVQGAEADLIEGGTEALRRTRYFYTEYNNQELIRGPGESWRIAQVGSRF